jgi:alanine dehydrogenase
MRIGVPRELKDGERRVGLTPENVRVLAGRGHEVRCETGLGAGIGEDDDAYRGAGARIVDAAQAWDAELVVKVKELQPGEAARLARGSTLFGFLQLVGAPQATQAIAERGANAIGYERVRDADGRFPLLAPMSVIAGRMAASVGAWLLGVPQGGNGTLLSGAPGVDPANVLVLGRGNAGLSAAEAASAMGAHVTVLGRSEATPAAVEAAVLAADLVIGAVHVAGQATPKLLHRALVARMRRGSVLVDICIDGGGVSETSRPTSHSAPTYVDEGVVHYCVANMPGAFPRTSARALCAAVVPYVEAMAERGVAGALRADPGLCAGVMIWDGAPTDARLAAEAGLPCRDLATIVP